MQIVLVGYNQALLQVEVRNAQKTLRRNISRVLLYREVMAVFLDMDTIREKDGVS